MHHFPLERIDTLNARPRRRVQISPCTNQHIRLIMYDLTSRQILNSNIPFRTSVVPPARFDLMLQLNEPICAVLARHALEVSLDFCRRCI
jgi:hypothetical protein